MADLVDARAATPCADVEGLILELLEEITQDWDLGSLTPETSFGSLGLESINLVYLIAELQQEYALEDALIARLRRDEIDVRELRVAEMAELVDELRRETGDRGGR